MHMTLCKYVCACILIHHDCHRILPKLYLPIPTLPYFSFDVIIQWSQTPPRPHPSVMPMPSLRITMCSACRDVVVSSSDPPNKKRAREGRGRVWNITLCGSVQKECCGHVIMTRNLAFVVSRAYRECKFCNNLSKRACAVQPVLLAFMSIAASHPVLWPINTCRGISAFGHFRTGLCSRPSLSAPFPRALFIRRVWGRDYPVPRQS